METIKTAAVVVLLLGVLYGVYVVLNKPELSPPPGVEVASSEMPDIQISAGGQAEELLDSPDAPSTTPPSEMQPSFPGIAANGGGQPEESGGADLAEPSAEDPPDAEPLIAENPIAVVPHEPQTGTGDGQTPEQQAKPELAIPAEWGPSIYEGGNSQPAEQPAAEPSPPAVADSGDADSIYGPPSQAKDDTRATEESPQTQTVRAFDSAWSAALGLVERESWTEALLTLSLRYHDQDLSAEERQRLLDLLDPLAGKVIYSRQHTLAPAHVVRAGETLEQIAELHKVPATLLQNINGIRDVQPGMELKVVPGPFRAEVDVESSQLVLFARKYYAGRFPVSLASDPPPGEYTVEAKQQGREYVTPDGRRLAAGAANNPYGRWWLGLGDDLAIHESPEELTPHGFGSISLKTADAADVYGILSVGAHVQVR